MARRRRTQRRRGELDGFSVRGPLYWTVVAWRAWLALTDRSGPHLHHHSLALYTTRPATGWPGPRTLSDRQARPLPPGASSSLASAAVLTATTASPSYPPGASPWRTCRRGQRACPPARPRSLSSLLPRPPPPRCVGAARHGGRTTGAGSCRRALAGRRDDATGPAIYTR